MELSKRHQKIMSLLKTNEVISVNELSAILKVSSVTIRKDLAFLEDSKLLYRAHGKAIMIDPYIANRHVQEKETHHPEEKERIGLEAIKMLVPNDAIIIASGTTVAAFSRLIPHDFPITVLTSALNVSLPLLSNHKAEIIQLGGIIRHTSTSTVGDYTLSMLKNFSCSKLFLGVDGIDLEYGLTTTNAMEASVNRAMIKSAQKVIVLTDSSKFSKRGFGRICGLESVDYIITDSNISAKVHSDLENMGVKVIIV